MFTWQRHVSHNSQIDLLSYTFVHSHIFFFAIDSQIPAPSDFTDQGNMPTDHALLMGVERNKAYTRCFVTLVFSKTQKRCMYCVTLYTLNESVEEAMHCEVKVILSHI